MKKNIIFGLTLLLIFGVSSFGCATTIDANKVAQQKNKKMNAKVETRRIPKGARLRIKLLDPVSTKDSSVGYMFNATLVNDEKVDNSMILPSGTLLRGYVQDIKSAKMASVGAILYLKFDHIVTPTGTQLPIKSSITNNEHLTYDGGIREQAGYGDALKENWQITKNITIKSTQWGWNIDNASKYVLAPLGAIGGGLGGGLYYVGDAFVDVFKKGKDVTLNQEDILEIIITKDLDVPVI